MKRDNSKLLQVVGGSVHPGGIQDVPGHVATVKTAALPLDDEPIQEERIITAAEVLTRLAHEFIVGSINFVGKHRTQLRQAWSDSKTLHHPVAAGEDNASSAVL